MCSYVEKKNTSNGTRWWRWWCWCWWWWCWVLWLIVLLCAGRYIQDVLLRWRGHISSVQFKMVPMRSEKPIQLCAPPRVSEVPPTLPLKLFQCSPDWRWSSLVLSRKIVSRFLFPCHSPPGINGVMSLALCPQVVSQASQHFRSSEKRAICEAACTVFMDGNGTLLDSEAPPWLVFGDWAISVHYEVLRFSVFLNEKLDLWLFCLLAILDSAFPSFLAGVSHRDAGIGLSTFPTPSNLPQALMGGHSSALDSQQRGLQFLRPQHPFWRVSLYI